MYVRPYSSCEIKDNIKPALSLSTDTELIDQFIASNKKYTSSICFDACYHSIMAKKCQCIDQSVPFPNLKNVSIPRFCYFEDDADSDCFSKIVEDLDETCGKKCPLECDLVITSVSTSFAAYLNNDSQYVGVEIYYNELSYEYSTESPAITEVALYSGLGGILGKFDLLD